MFDPNEVFPDECDLCNFEDYWEEGRYTIRYRRQFSPEEKVLEGFDDLDEAERFLEGLVYELE